MNPPNLQKRIMGCEQEWCIIPKKNGDTDLSFFHILSQIEIFFKDCMGPYLIPSNLRFSNSDHIAFNGARIYLDTGAHLEYASPEALGPLWAAAHDKAGERIVEEAIKKANLHPELKNWWSFTSYKNNLDRSALYATKLPIALISYGLHENYLALKNKTSPADVFFRSMFGLFLISRQVFTGNGLVCAENDRLGYYISQRATTIVKELSSNAAADRAIISAKDEPLTNIDKYCRVHVILGDSCILEPAIILKYGTTSMVLDAIEEGYFIGHPYLGIKNLNMVFLLREFTFDSELTTTVELLGKRLTIIDIQEEYYSRIKKFYEDYRDIGQEESLVFDLWEKVLTAARYPRPYEALSPYVDWAAKKLIIEEDMERRGYSWTTPITQIVKRSRKGRHSSIVNTALQHAKEIDFKFHENSPRGLARILIDSSDSSIPRLIPEEYIQACIHNPPPNTRACVRAQQIRKLDEEARMLGKTFQVQSHHWSHIRIDRGDNNVLTINIPNPFDAKSFLVHETKNLSKP